MSCQIALHFLSHGAVFPYKKTPFTQLFVSLKFSLSSSFGVTETGDPYYA